MIEDVGWFWDHADKRHLIAHDYLIANYVCTSGKHYALEFRRFRKSEDCQAWQAELAQREGGVQAASEKEQRLATFKGHTELFKELVDGVVEWQIPGDFAFDCYFTNAEILNHINGTGRGYTGDLKFNRKVWFKGMERKASEMAKLIGAEDRKRVEISDRRQWYFTKTIHIPGVDHAVRIAILWDRKNAAEPAKMVVTNRTYRDVGLFRRYRTNRTFWEVTRILRGYRRRWTGTETFHRDGKQELGLGDCQLRSGEGQTRHFYLVMMAHSLAVAELGQNRVRDWARVKLTTIGEACRAVMRETLGKTITWTVERALSDGWDCGRITAHLALT